MHLTILTVGSRGDVQPFVALGQGLQKAGFEVRIATHRNLEKLVRENGLDYAPVSGNVNEVLRSKEVQAVLKKGGNPFKLFFKELKNAAEPLVFQAVKENWEACQGTDCIIATAITAYLGHFISDKMGLPLVLGLVNPGGATRAFPSIIAPRYPAWLPFGKNSYNYVSHLAVDILIWVSQRAMLNRNIKKVFDAPPYSLQPPLWNPTQPLLLLYAYTPSVLPKPTDWTDYQRITGCWFLEENADFEPPTDLTNFINEGQKPVYVGFGSMGGTKEQDQKEGMADLILEALKISGQRGVVLNNTGLFDDMDLPDTVFPIKSAPFGWLFPQMAAVAHHGGVGTMALGFRAGVPNVMVPSISDQRFWGNLIFEQKTGPKPIPRKKLTAQNLATAITEAINNPTIQKKAAALGKKVRAEKGVELAVHHIVTFLKKSNAAQNKQYEKIA